MSQVVAVYQDGVFKPLSPIALPENQLVQLQIEPAEPAKKPDWMDEVLERKRRFIAQHGVLPDSTPDVAADRAR